MLKKKNNTTNNSAVAVPMEALVAFGIVMLTIAFLLASINNFFVPYIATESEFDYMAINICESLIRNPGETTYGSVNWEDDPGNTSVLGLSILYPPADPGDIGYTEIVVPSEIQNGFLYPTLTVYPATNVKKISHFDAIYVFPMAYYDFMLERIRQVYAVLDQVKIDHFNLENISYQNAKNLLGLDIGYDFNLTITKINLSNVQMLDEVILQYGPSYTDAQIVIPFSRDVMIYPDTPAKLKVYVFR